MRSIKEYIVKNLSSETSFDPERFVSLFKIPDKAERGDLALPCFPFAKELKKKPNEIAAEWQEKFQKTELFSLVKAEGPFLNFYYSPKWLAENVIPEVLENSETFGNGDDGKGKSVVLDFSSPNIAKPIAFHHIRSTIIGHTLANLHAARGWKVERINYLGDWGTQFGKLIVAYKNWGTEEELNEKKIKHLLELYVRFHNEVEEKPELEDEARGWFVKMENNDEDALELWKLFYKISIDEFDRVYNKLGVYFDYMEGESFYKNDLENAVKKVEETAGTTISQGATVVDLEDEKLPPCLLKKADGATLYATRDIAAAMDRYNRFGFDRSLYVVASQQSLYFKQLFTVLGKMGFEWSKNMIHVSFGMLQLKDQTMSTRKGQVIFLDEVIERAVALSKESIENKNPDLANKDEIAQMVGVGALIFNGLVNHRTNDITFEWERVLSFQGETGVYVQYAYARCKSMLRKAGKLDKSKFDSTLLERQEEKDVLKIIGQFPDKVEKAANDLDPSVVAKHLIELCKSFNKLYTIEGYRFLDDNETTKTTRLILAETASIMLKRGMSLLGMKSPEEM